MSDWRDIPGYDGFYQINRMGEVRSWRGYNGLPAKAPKAMKTHLKKNVNMLFVRLTPSDGNSRLCCISTIMRDVWMNGKVQGLVVWHKNGNTRDNCLHNLGYISLSDLGKKTGAKSKRRPVAKVDRDGNEVEFYPSARAAAAANFMSPQTVVARCHGYVQKPYDADGYSYRWDD